MALGGTLASCGAGAPALRAQPGGATPIYQPVRISVVGAAPGTSVTLRARARFLGRAWTSSATYRVPPSGTLDLDRVAPVGGSYSGVAGMGLLWSLRSPSGTTASVASIAAPEKLELTLAGSGAAPLRLTRYVAPAGLRSQRLRPGPGQPLYGDYLRPAGAAGPLPGVVIIGGSEGGLDTGLPVAAALASEGMAALDLAYFGLPGLPAQLDLIPLEYFARALTWLARQPGVDPRRVDLYGVSRGTEAALLSSSYFPGLVHGVAALVPSDSVLCGAPSCTTSGWTYRGRPLPFTRQVSNPRPTDVPAAVIPVGRYPGRVLLACAGHDTRWDSCAYARAIAASLRAAGRPAPELLDYPGAGHGLGFALPYLPELDGPGLAGATPEANPRARAEEWPRIVAFLKGG